MATSLGDIIRIGGSLASGDTGDWASFTGNLLDAGTNYLKETEAEKQRKAALAYQQRIMAQEQAQAAKDNALNDAIKQEILQKSANLQEALKQAYDYLGMPYQPNMQSVTSDYAQLRNQMTGDLDKLAGMALSKGYANNLAKGMGDSTLQEDEQANLVRKLADQYAKVDQSAYDQAIARSQSTTNLLNSTRGDTLSEIDTIYGGNNIKNLQNLVSSKSATVGNDTAKDVYKAAAGTESATSDQTQQSLIRAAEDASRLFDLNSQQQQSIAELNGIDAQGRSVPANLIDDDD